MLTRSLDMADNLPTPSHCSPRVGRSNHGRRQRRAAIESTGTGEMRPSTTMCAETCSVAVGVITMCEGTSKQRAAPSALATEFARPRPGAHEAACGIVAGGSAGRQGEAGPWFTAAIRAALTSTSRRAARLGIQAVGRISPVRERLAISC
jgi:hypothetical protein